MTTDITELAQSEINDALAQLKQLSEYPTPSTQYARVLRKYITSQAEALEKAQAENTAGVAGMAESYETTISMLRSRIAELEESHAQVIQSRDHYKRISEEGLKQLAESRTVTVKLPEVERPIDGTGYANAAGAQYYKERVIKALTAQGIKVEDE
ncbi:TPA: hypothetical protein N3552_000468 [Klebsiella variicola]|nr:hypothetical protein [Klebsiella variicola]